MTTVEEKEMKASADPPEKAAAQQPAQAMVPVDAIAREIDNHRAAMDPGKLDELADSISRQGLMNPIGVCQRSRSGAFVLIFGHRRLEATRKLGHEMILARIWRDLGDVDIAEMQAIENLQREDLTPIDEAVAFQALIDAGQGVDTVASRVDRSAEFIRGRLDLLRLDPKVRAVVACGRLPIKHARAIARLGDPKDQRDRAARALGAGYQDSAPKFLDQQATEPGEYVEPLRALRQGISCELQNLAGVGCTWPKDEKYAGKRACTGCPDNTNTEPALFDADGFTIKGTSKKGNCTNTGCFEKKFNAWQKDPVKPKRDAERAAKKKAKAKEKGEAAPAPGGKKHRPFPDTPEERYAVALYEYGEKIEDEIRTGVPALSALPDDALAVLVVAAYSLAGVGGAGEIYLPNEHVKVPGPPALAGGLGHVETVAMPEGLAAEFAAAVQLPYARPDYLGWRDEVRNVPLPGDFMEGLAVLEALAKRLGLAVVDNWPVRPSEDDFSPAAVLLAAIRTAKRPEATAAVKACEDLDILRQADDGDLKGDWRRSSVRKRIKQLEKAAEGGKGE